MTLKWLAQPKRGGLHFTPREIRWLIAEPGATAPIQVVDGGVLPLSGSAIPALEELETVLEPVLAAHNARWNATVSTRIRAEVVALPPLEESEVAQAARWQAERTFNGLGGHTLTDYELLSVSAPTPNAAGTTATAARNALLVAVPDQERDAWSEVLGGLSVRPRRIEPFATAFERALRSSRVGITPGQGHIGIYADSGGASIVVSLDGHAIALRGYTSSADPEETSLGGEAGVRAVLETLVSCEDQYPTTTFTTLSGFGDVDSVWLEELALATRLDLQPSLAPPPSVPESLVARDGWLIPFGAVEGAAS